MQSKIITRVSNGDQWHALIESVFGSVEMQIGNRSLFRARIRRSVVGDVELSDVVTSYEDARRAKRHIAADVRDYFVLAMPQTGSLYLSQAGRECTVTPGSMAFFDLNSPHRYFHGGEARILDIKVPAAMMRSRIRQPDNRTATVFSADRGVPKITLDFIRSMTTEMFELTPTVAAGYLPRLMDMIALLTDCEPNDAQLGRSSLRQVIRSRCVALIETDISDPDLGPEWLAARCGVSTRYIHTVFKDTDETAAEFIRNRRLAICYDRLCRRAAGGVQIKDIALAVGFRSAAHFCNAFKARYGMSPRAVQVNT